MKRSKNILFLLPMLLLAVSAFCQENLSPTTQAPAAPLVLLPVTDQTPPAQVAEAFFRSLEQYLQFQYTQPDLAKGALAYAAGLIADSVVDQPADKEDLASGWAAVVNFYRGYIDYDLSRKQSPVPTSHATVLTTRLFAHRPGPTRPVNIVVVCKKEPTGWRLKSVSLTPAPTSQPAE
jgi:hypothetical protein